MATSKNHDQLTAPDLLGAMIADVLQEQMLGDTEDRSPVAESGAQGVANDFDNLILTDIIRNSRVTTIDICSEPSEPSVEATATSVVNDLNMLENRLSSVFDQGNTSFGTNPSDIIIGDNDATVQQPSTPTEQIQSSIITDDNRPVQFDPSKHIMISYHHESSFELCRRICARLRDRGYKVWMDANNLHGSIHQGMAEAVENSYIVLFCMNDHYYRSEYCKKEVLYTDKRHKKFIPCLLQPSYEPHGWLGMVIADQLYIDFSSFDNFDKAFQELIYEIQDIESRSQLSPTQTVTSPLDRNMRSATVLTNSAMSSQASYDSLRIVVSDFRESINQRNQDTQSMTEEEFSQFVNYIRQRIFNNTSPSPRTGNNNSQEILQEILHHTRDQTEFLRRITDILSNLTETKTIIKLSLAFAFVWSMNTFFKHK